MSEAVFACDIAEHMHWVSLDTFSMKAHIPIAVLEDENGSLVDFEGNVGWWLRRCEGMVYIRLTLA